MNCSKRIELMLLMGLLNWAGALVAAVPGQIHYQGRLTDAEGSAVNGPVAMAVRMYDAASGGTLLYEEDLGSITVTDGAYSFGFGAAGTGTTAGQEIFANLTSVEHWLELVIDGVESTPRTRLLAVPYALKARESETSADAQALAEKIAVINKRLETAGIAPAGMVRVEGGTLSTSNDLNGTAVSTFFMGQYEVTWNEWQTVRTYAAANGYDIGSVGTGCADDHPVHSVNWYDAIKWCNAKSEMDGLTPVYSVGGAVYRSGQSNDVVMNAAANGYRLPMDAEWEFAARGGIRTNGYTYAGSNDLGEVGWYMENSGGTACPLSSGRGTWPVGQKAANELGLYDMSGNVWEWCWDRWSDTSSNRVNRGGSWTIFASGCAVSIRDNFNPTFRFSSYGFRLARSPG